MIRRSSRTDRRQSLRNHFILRVALGSLCLFSLWNVLHRPDSVFPRLTDAQTLAILTTHCPALRQQPDVLGCLPDPTGIRLITDRPALMPKQVAGFPVLTEPPPPHLPPPPGVIVLWPEGPDPQPTLSHCPPGYIELQKYRWRFCNSPAIPQPIPTGLMTPPIAGIPYMRAEAIFQRQDFVELPGVQSVGLGAGGIVVQTSEPTLVPSTFEGLPVRTEAPQGVLYPTNHTFTTVPFPLRGGVAIGPGGITSSEKLKGFGGGTLGGFAWSGGEPWLVTAAHLFPAKCGSKPPCPTEVIGPTGKMEQVPLHECSDSDSQAISAKLAPLSATPVTVSTLTRWTQLTKTEGGKTVGATVKADVAAGFVDVVGQEKSGNIVGAYPINRRLENFSKMVTGHTALPMQNDEITIVSARGSLTYWGRDYESPYALPGKVTMGSVSLTDKNQVPLLCPGEIEVGFQDVFALEAKADPQGSTTPVRGQINRNYILSGVSGALVLDGSGNILGMQLSSRVQRVKERATEKIVDAFPTRKGHAMKATNIKAALQFDHWVGSETLPLQGGFTVETSGDPPVPTQLAGWAVDPLNPRAALPLEIRANGTKVDNPTLTRQASEAAEARGYPSGEQGFVWQIPETQRNLPASQWAVYALDTATTPAVRRKLPLLKPAKDWPGLSTKGLALLKNYEGFVAYPYDDRDEEKTKTRVTTYPTEKTAEGKEKRKRLTIGYGHTIKRDTEWKGLQEKYGKGGQITMTESQASMLLQSDLAEYIGMVQKLVKVPLSEAEFDALVLLAFNIGGSLFPDSSVVRFLDKKKNSTPSYATLEEAWQAFYKESVPGKEKKKRVPGLRLRRRDEYSLFSREDYERTYD